MKLSESFTKVVQPIRISAFHMFMVFMFFTDIYVLELTLQISFVGWTCSKEKQKQTLWREEELVLLYSSHDFWGIEMQVENGAWLIEHF